LEAWKALCHPEDLQRAIGKIEAYLISKEGVYESTYRIRCKDGQYRWILSHGKGYGTEMEIQFVLLVLILILQNK
jgi:PAS domain-containing protein